MKKLLFFSAMAMVLLLWSGSTTLANDVVLDRHFETQQAGPLTYWNVTVNDPAVQWAFLQNAVKGPADWSWCFSLYPSNNPMHNGNITQTVYLIQGVTYDFFANVASHEHWGNGYNDGGRLNVKIGGQLIHTHSFGPITGYQSLYSTMSTTYTCTASGPYELFISIYRQEYNEVCVEVCVDNVSLKPQAQSLKVAPNDISASGGGQPAFTFDVGPTYAGKGYIIFASMSGSYPGLPLGPVTIHLNWDFITDLTLPMVIGNSFPFGAFHGTLDAQGKALPTFTVPPGNMVPASAALYFGGIVYDPAIGNAIIHSTYPSYVLFTP